MLDARSLDLIFREARTHNAFSGSVTDAQLRELYDLLKWGPTTMNTQPARIVFVRSPSTAVMPSRPCAVLSWSWHWYAYAAPLPEALFYGAFHAKNQYPSGA